MNAQTREKVLTNLSFGYKRNADSLIRQLSLLIMNTKVYSNTGGKVILALEYIQLISQALTLYPALYDNPEGSKSALVFQILINLIKFVTPTSVLSLEDSSSAARNRMLTIMVLTVGKFLVYFYVMMALIFKWKKNRYMIQIFQWLLRVQTRILYFFISSFWISILILHKEESKIDFNVLQMGRFGYNLVCIFMVVLEFLISLLPKLFYHYMLPSKDFLASKDNYTETITLIQKFVIQIIQIAVPFNSIAARWVLTVVNLIIPLIRNVHYFTTLPFYKIEALFFHSKVLMIAASFNIAGFFQLWLRYEEPDSYNIEFVVVTGIIISLLCIKLLNQALNQILIFAVTSHGVAAKFSPLLLHKAALINQLLELKKQAYSYGISLLLANIEKQQNENNDDQQLNAKEGWKTFVLSYMEDLERKSPENNVMKLHLAFY